MSQGSKLDFNAQVVLDRKVCSLPSASLPIRIKTCVQDQVLCMRIVSAQFLVTVSCRGMTLLSHLLADSQNEPILSSVVLCNVKLDCIVKIRDLRASGRAIGSEGRRR